MKLDITQIIEKGARKKKRRIVICEGWDERCLVAAADILENELAEIVLLGNPKQIAKKASDLKLDISNARIVDHKNSELKTKLVEKLVEVRKHKGMTQDKAYNLVENVNYFGCLYTLLGYADAVAGSAICPTGELMRPALQILREKGKLVSEVIISNDHKKERTLFFTDASLNINPSAEDLSQIAQNAIGIVKQFGVEPKVALLSFSTKGSGGNTPEIEIVREATAIVQKNNPKVKIDGEMQFDAATNPFANKRKCPNSPIKGDANILVYPNLTTANIATHALMQLSELEFDFAMLAGLQKPVAILGRSTPQESVRNMIVGLCMQVNNKNG